MKNNIIIRFIKKHKITFILLFIASVGFYLRTFNINWDNNYYFHPDERAIVMFADPIHLPSNFSEFLKPESPLNPHFFAYGNFPLYLLRLLGFLAGHFNSTYLHYGGLHIVGRLISAIFDTGTIFLVFLLSSRLFSKKAGLFSALLYSLSVFPIQLSHFFAVDTILNFFMTATILLLVAFIKKGNFLNSIFIGIVTGLALATKISALILIVPIGITMAFYAKLNYKKKNSIFITLLFPLLILFSALLITSVTQPYMIIDWQNFISQTTLQSKMSSDPFLFPYTLQYVGKIPYIHELYNIVLFGQGPIIFTLSILGLIFYLKSIFKKRDKNRLSTLIVLIYVVSYFLLFGKFAVGWMRYMLPVYPILSVLGGYFSYQYIFKKFELFQKNFFYQKAILLLFAIMIAIYPLTFVSIYLHPNTRIQASEWIHKNIQPGKTIAVEHWDDALPVYDGSVYPQVQLTLYDPDTPQKWNTINGILSATDYIIIASNRLYVPLQKLNDCNHLPEGKCYTQTAIYYKKLFSNELGFHKVAEFTDYPTVPFLNLKLVDDSADESFTVYDHPKIFIFKKD